ncbi:9747_t:CDS:2 [Entrophospora sp. SA101]|nr:9747_t:CDS:2 [Entrophospora sp. SA101]
MSKKVASHALKNNDFEVWWSSNDKSPTSSGVGLMIKKSISIYVQKVKESNGRIIYADLFLPHQKIRIINVYINSSTSTEWDRKERLQTENETISIIEEGKKNNYSNIIIGDFNADPDKLELDRMNNKKIDRKYHLIKFLQNKNYIDIHTNIEDDKCYTWKNNNSTSRIDLIWMPNNMLDEVFFCETWKSPLYSSDHRMVITYLHKNNIIFNTKEANIKRKQMRRQVFSFDNMKEEDWLKYAETSDSLWKDSQMNKFKFPENPGHHDLNRMWDAVRNTLIKTAEKTIPKRWVSESFKDIKSKELIKNYSYLRKVNKILIKFNNIKIYNDKIPSQTEWNKDIKILNNIINNDATTLT